MSDGVMFILMFKNAVEIKKAWNHEIQMCLYMVFVWCKFCLLSDRSASNLTYKYTVVSALP